MTSRSRNGWWSSRLRCLRADSRVGCPSAYVEHFEGANRAVRKGNRQLLARDREAYRQRWEGIFWEPDGPELRDQLTVSFDDPSRTASRFPSDQPPLAARIVRRAGSTGKRALSRLAGLAGLSGLVGAANSARG